MLLCDMQTITTTTMADGARVTTTVRVLSTLCIDETLHCMCTLHECGSNFPGLTSAVCRLVDNNNNNGGWGANNNNSELSGLIMLCIERSWSEKRACIKEFPVQNVRD